MREIFAEMGLGNANILSTEIEDGDKEYRVKGFVAPKKIRGIYIRIWLFKKVFILSSLNGFELIRKRKNKFKIIFGIRGTDK
tara:strand:+ start:1069 stop:1314 length:246 start_codon:yes stop_codon:yes gene_type:complete